MFKSCCFEVFFIKQKMTENRALKNSTGYFMAFLVCFSFTTQSDYVFYEIVKLSLEIILEITSTRKYL